MQTTEREQPEHSLMQFFQYNHLPPHVQSLSSAIYDLASMFDDYLPANSEKTTALRKLLEAKDCAVRSQLYRGI